MCQKLKSDGGITLVEILIALLITGVLSMAMFKIYINQHHAWMIQESVIEMQQNARAGIDELIRQIRMTGYELPNGLPPIEAYDTNPDTIIIHYRGARDCSPEIYKDMPLPSAELDCTAPGTDVSCYKEGETAYIFDPFTQQGEFFEISHVQNIPGKIQHNKSILSRCYPKGSIILPLDRIKFYVDQSNAEHPKLMIQLGLGIPQVYAEDIVDLQLEYVLKNGMVVSTLSISQDVRQVKMTLTGRTPDPDPEFENDPYRYETYTSNVYMRNMGT